MSREVACWCFLCFPHFSFPSRWWKLTRKVVEVQCLGLFGELVFRVFVSRSDWSSDGLGKNLNKGKQVQDHLQIFKNRLNGSSRHCHLIVLFFYIFESNTRKIRIYYNCSDFEHNVWSNFKVEVQAKFEAGVWLIFCCWCFVEVMKLNLGRDSGQDFEF